MLGQARPVLSNNPILSGLWLLIMLGYEVMKGYGGGLLDHLIYIYISMLYTAE